MFVTSASAWGTLPHMNLLVAALMESEVPTFVIGLITLAILLIALLIVRAVGNGRPHC